MNIKNAVDKQFENKTLTEILKSPIHALQGLSERQATLVKEAFRITTIEQFSKLRFAKWAWAIQVLAGYEKEDNENEGMLNIENAIDKAWEKKSLDEILEAPMQILQGLSERQADIIYEAFKIKTVKQLANLRFFRMAKAIYFLALCEDPGADPNVKI